MRRLSIHPAAAWAELRPLEPVPERWELIPEPGHLDARRYVALCGECLPPVDSPLGEMSTTELERADWIVPEAGVVTTLWVGRCPRCGLGLHAQEENRWWVRRGILR